ncbi:MAG: hypothetical protein B6D41_05695 [Chloroflexi bacterium UTCFX4]|nr:MAG: hypothetical protein B6D41_05695 [Chloroflexi bacterium UTCFX4]
MLYMASDSSKLQRLQGCFVSDQELEKLVTYWKGFIELAPSQPSFDSGRPSIGAAPIVPLRVAPSPSGDASGLMQGALWNLAAEPKKSEEDDLLAQAIQIVQDNERASVSLLQRKLRIGYSRAARLIELLEQKGYVGQDEGPTKGREVLSPPVPAPIQKAPSPTITNGAKKSARPGASDSAAKKSAPSNVRKFEGNDLGDFEDFTDKDWADLDKG